MEQEERKGENMRTKTDEEILKEVKAEVLRVFGIEQPRRGRPRGATGTMMLWKAGDKWYRHKKNATATGLPAKKHDLDAMYLLECYETEGFEYHCEDISHDEYIATLKQKVNEYYGKD